jgi:very-short-patch-repair endonuclease
MSATETKRHIQAALEACATGDLSERALHLLKTLGYHGPRLSYFKRKSYDEFKEVFVQRNERFNEEKTMARQWKTVDVLFQLTADQLTKQDSLFRNEQVDNTIIESYLFFVIELKPKKEGAYTRTDLSHITREVNKCFAMPAMILFKHSDTLSFAVIDRRLHKRESSKDVLEKVTLIKDIRTASPHRAHIEILFDLSLEELKRKHGFTTFPALHEAWRKTLDTKELNKRFFRELANWYFHAVEVAEFPDDIEKDRDKRNAINTIRLITRLMFVWFLREKDLVPDALFDPRELKKILKPDAKEPSIYYKAILQNLFFATLNTEMGKRRFLASPDKSQSPHHFIHSVFRYEHCFTDPKRTLKELFDPIPFLNGGLFECLDKQVEVKGELKPTRIDGFSNNPKNKLLVPDKLFFDAEGEEHDFSTVYGTTRARKEKVRGLIDILSSYKFTITENTPIEEEVALDPELLGKVFENLLANYNPETRTTARKQTGSFYTPREIVNYMVDESLIAYLKGALTPALSKGEGGMPLTPGPNTPSPQPSPKEREQYERGEMPADDNTPTWAEKPGYMTGDPATAAKLMAYANAMRKEPTEAEDKLWQAIRGHATGGRIRRQHIIGNFIVDFVSLPKRLVIEIDGDIHDLQKEEDEARTALLNEYGFKVIRFRNEEVLTDVFAVKRAIVAELDARPDVTEAHSSPSPSERGPGGEGVSPPSPPEKGPGVEGALTPTLSQGQGAAHSPPSPSEKGSGDEGELRLRHLLSYTEEPHQFTPKETERLIAAIDNCKILDPACGSGAFPMGVLHKLVHVLHKLDPQNKQWKERQIEKAAQLDDAEIRERTIADIEDAFEHNALDYGRKLYLIENGIYGVDIQPIAMQIAKLRFFISLIVDQKAVPYSPLSLGEGPGVRANRGVRPLPNLETKFVAANTLMKLEKENANLFTNPAIEKKKEQLKRVRHDYFEARTPKRKEKCRADDKKLREELAELLVQNHDFQPKTAKMLAAWDPYDQNASAPFFDPEWMFGLSGGFDVVIGNPPYIPLEDMKPDERAEMKRRFPMFDRKYETSAPFTVLGLDLLSHQGWLTYITPQTWETGENYSRFRERLATSRVVRIVVNLPFDTFEAAYVDAGIFLLGKSPAESFKLFSYAKDEAVGDISNVPYTTVAMSALRSPQYKIPLDATASRILERCSISGAFEPLGEITSSTQGLARSSFPETRRKEGKDVYPCLREVGSLKYNVHVMETYLTDMSEHQNLKAYYDAAPRVFIRRIIGRDDKLVVGYYEKRLVTSKDINPFIPTKTAYTAKYLTGILASQLLSYLYLRSSSIANKDDFRQTTLAELRKLPIPNPPAKVKAQLEKLVESRLGLTATATDARQRAEAERIEREIDQVVYGLYGLTAEEIKIVEGSGKRKGGAVAQAANGQEGEEAPETSTPRKRGRPRKG